MEHRPDSSLPSAGDQAVLIIPSDQDPPLDVVRWWVSRALVGLPELPLLHTCLVCEELVANARTHGRRPHLLRLVLAPNKHALRVFADDCDPGRSAGWTSGAGLALVDGLSRGWGVERRAGGKTVWAEIALGLRVDALTIPPQPPPGQGSA